jgi:hypothetical protein
MSDGKEMKAKKSILFFIFTGLFCFAGQQLYGQVYDGMTQPTLYRIMSANNIKGSTTLQLGRKWWIDKNRHFSTTVFYTYFLNKDNHAIESWNNLNLFNKQLYLLSRTGYNITTNNLWETFSGSCLLPYNMMLDFTWYNLYNNNEFFVNDELQVLYGVKLFNQFVVNGGYRIFGETPGPVFNIRFLLVDGFQWLQFRYVPNDKLFDIKLYIQFNILKNRKPS